MSRPCSDPFCMGTPCLLPDGTDGFCSADGSCTEPMLVMTTSRSHLSADSSVLSQPGGDVLLDRMVEILAHADLNLRGR